MSESPEPIDAETDAGAPDTGEVAAAMKNRQITARLQIVEALQRLGIAYAQWPDFVREFYKNPQERAGFGEITEPPLFQPPIFDRLRESPKEWKKAADAAWEQHCTTFREKCQYSVTAAEDEKIPPAKTTRGPGRNGRRLNAPLSVRFDWAARRLSGAAWKEIGGDTFNQDQVKKAASEALKLAGWPTKARPTEETSVSSLPSG